MSRKLFKTKDIQTEKNETKNDKKDFKEFNKFYNSTHFEKPTVAKSWILVISLIISVIFGFIAGMLSLFLFLSGTFSNSKLFSWLDINSLLPTTHLIIQRQEQTTVLEDERIIEVAKEVTPVVVGIFKYKEPVEDEQKNFYQPEEFLGSGLILTNDGWIVTTNDIVKIDGQYNVVTQNLQVYKVDKIDTDGSLGLIFLKVDTGNLPVISMTKLENVYSGERVVSIGGLDHFNKDLIVTRVASNDFIIVNKLIRSSENYHLYISLIQELDKKFYGGPVFNLNKQMIGLVSNYNNQNYLIPVDYLKKSFDQLLSKNKIERTYLGIEYTDLSRNITTSAPSNFGALIMNIKKDSPLIIDQNVKAGDIIIKVDNNIVNGNNNLTNLIQGYKKGDKINLTIVDKDSMEEKVTKVELK